MSAAIREGDWKLIRTFESEEVSLFNLREDIGETTNLKDKYPKQVGLHEAVLFPFSEHGLSPEEVTFPELLKPLGYNTACIGKWHLGGYPSKLGQGSKIE